MGAQDWIEVFVALFVVSVAYGFCFYPVYNYIKAWLIWFGQAGGMKELIDLANLISLVLAFIPVIFVIYLFIWLFFRIVQKEKHQMLY